MRCNQAPFCEGNRLVKRLTLQDFNLKGFIPGLSFKLALAALFVAGGICKSTVLAASFVAGEIFKGTSMH